MPKLPLLLVALMISASVAGLTIRPSATAAQRGQGVSLESAVPEQFGDWKLVKTGAAQVVNPQTQEMLDKLYSQILTRTYVNSEGYVIMLSMAYGDDQRGGLQAHRPEVCYPAQGFQLLKQADRPAQTDFGPVEARRLETALGQRVEPVTYWLAVGGETVMARHEKRFAEMRLALTGQVPDGLLFRVSSIDRDSQRAFGIHDRFVNDLLNAVPPAERRRLAGLGGKPAGG